MHPYPYHTPLSHLHGARCTLLLYRAPLSMVVHPYRYNSKYDFIRSEAVFSSSNPLVGRLRILGFVVETDVCGARLGSRRTRLFLTSFLSHFRKRRCVTLSAQGPSWARSKAHLGWKEDTLRPNFFGGGPSNTDSSILKHQIVLPGLDVPQ